MKIAFNPSTVAALTTPPNNKDITFDLRGRNIFARGVKFKGTDTNTWRDIKINNVSIGSSTLDLRNGSNTTLTNTNGVVTINSTWRPVVDNLTSDSTTSSLSAKQGKVLKALIDGKSNSDHNHDGRYLKLTGGTMASNAMITFADSGSQNTNKGPQGARGGLYWTGQSDYAKLYAEETVGDNLDLVIQFGDDNSNGLSIRNKANTQTSYISSSGVITTGTFKGNLDWSYITNKPSSYTPSAHTHAWNSLTHSSTTENQAILTNGKANGWKLQTLNIARWDNAANNAHSHANKSVLDGITSALVNSWNTAYNFVSNITGTDTDKVINKWEEIVNFLAGITEDNKLNTLLNSKLSIQQLSAKDILTTKTNNALFWVDTKGNASTITTGPFTDHPYALLSVTNYNQNAENHKFFYRSRLAFSSAGDIKVSSCHYEHEYQQDETWYNVLTSKNSGISGSTIKLNGTSITVYSSGTADGRYLRLTGGWMQGDINFGGDNKIYWGRNTDSASISFKNDGDGDANSYMSFVTSDNGNEYFRWSHSSGSTNTEWMALRSDGLRVRGIKVSLEGHSHNDLYYTKAESNAKYITDIATSVNKLTFTRNGSNIARNITVNVVYSQGNLTNISNKDNTTKASSGLYIYNSYNQVIGTNSYSSVLSINTGGTIQIAGNWGDDQTRNLYWRSQSDGKVADYPWKSWRTILDSENYSSTLDSRYYTESEVNSLLDAKLNRQNLSYGTWNPRGWNLAADYHYNGGDLSISENNGKMYVSVDGCFWQNEGQYRVLDTSDIGDIRDSVTLHQYYWANVKISTSSSTTTSPTVHTLTATRVCAGHNPGIDNSISCSNWFRSSGNTGWYNTTYQGGWYMSDTSWIRAHNGVGIYTSGQIYSSSSIRMSNILLEHTDEINNSANGGIHLNYRNSGNVSLCYGGGNVGIGTTTPSYKLDVNGQMRASGFHHSSVNSDNYILLAGGGYKSFGGDNSTPIFLGCLDLYCGDDGTISSFFYCLGYSVPFTYTRGGNYCKIVIPDTTRLSFYIIAATASVNYSGGGMDTWTGYHRGSGAWWLHCYAFGWNEVRVKGFCQANKNYDSWWGGNPLWNNEYGANRITVCIFGHVKYK